MEEVWNVDRTGAVEGSGRRNAGAGSSKQQWLREKETQKDRNSFLVTVFEVLRGRWRKEISAYQVRTLGMGTTTEADGEATGSTAREDAHAYTHTHSLTYTRPRGFVQVCLSPSSALVSLFSSAALALP